MNAAVRQINDAVENQPVGDRAFGNMLEDADQWSNAALQFLQSIDTMVESDIN